MLFSKRGYAKRNKSFIAREGRYSSLSAPKGGALPALPQPENITMHWDLTDLSTMWKDTSRTTPVTTDGDQVAAIDNIAGASAYTVSLQQVNTLYRPEWNEAEGCPKFDQSDVLFGNITEAGSTNGGTFAWLGVRKEDTNDNLAILFKWHSFNRYGVWYDYVGGVPSDFKAYCATGTPGLATEPSHAALWSGVAKRTGTNAQKYFYSADSSPVTGVGTDSFPTAGIEFDLGANGNVGTNGHFGFIREVIFWDGTILSDAECLEIAAYDTAKHGTVWSQ